MVVGMAKLKSHPVAALFPLLEGDAFESFKCDIAAHGLRESIWLHEGQIIDGRNRYRACLETGTTPTFRQWNGQGSLVAFVISLNLHRRHLDESQRAMVGARIANLRLGANQHKKEGSSFELPISQPEAEKLLNVGTASVKRGRVVLERGAPELISAVDAGKIAVSAAAQIAERPKEQQRAAVDRVMRLNAKAPNVVREMNRQDRIGKLVEAGTPGTRGVGRFAVVLADPPWPYQFSTSKSREIENQYPTMSLEEICALDISEMLLPDCTLFLWSPPPKLDEAMSVIRAWSFSFRTTAIWDKEMIGPGYYFRTQHELLLVATKGEPPPPPPSARVSSVIRSRRGEHSVKPAIVYEIIERMYPELPKLELFQRRSRVGWWGWGNQVDAWGLEVPPSELSQRCRFGSRRFASAARW